MAKLKGQPKLTLDIRLPKEPPEYRIDLSNNRVNPDHFPFSVWAKLMRGVILDEGSTEANVTKLISLIKD